MTRIRPKQSGLFSQNQKMSEKEGSNSPFCAKVYRLGQFYLYNDLRQNPLCFYEYLQMGLNTFSYMLDKTAKELQKCYKNYPKTLVSACKMLVGTLRYVTLFNK